MRKLTFMILSVVLAVCMCATADELPNYKKLSVPWGKSINLEDYDGPHIEISILDRDISEVRAQIVDYSVLIPKAKSSTNGNNQVVMSPSTQMKKIEKSEGIPLPGGSSGLAKMYLIFEHKPSGIKVYFYDEIASMNFDSLVVALPQNPPPH